MQAQLARGVAPAEAAEQAKAAVGGGHVAREPGGPADAARRGSASRSRPTTAPSAERVLDRALLNLGLAQTIQLVVLPCLRDVGQALGVRRDLRRRRALRDRRDPPPAASGSAAGWDEDGDRVALLACAPGEQHDVGLLCFGLALHSYHGWRITYLGADTPLRGSRPPRPRRSSPTSSSSSAMTPARFFPDLERWRTLAPRVRARDRRRRGRRAARAKRIGAAFLGGDPGRGRGPAAARRNTRAVYVSLSRLRVAAERADELVEAFRNRAHLVDDADGFVDLEVWRSDRDPTS